MSDAECMAAKRLLERSGYLVLPAAPPEPPRPEPGRALPIRIKASWLLEQHLRDVIQGRRQDHTVQLFSRCGLLGLWWLALHGQAPSVIWDEAALAIVRGATAGEAVAGE